MSLVASLPHKLSKNKKGKGGVDKGGSGRLLITVNVLGRFPVLGCNVDNMLLYCANSGSDALSHWETIGSRGIRNFLLCKKQVVPDAPKPQPPRGGSWKAWFNRSFNFKISSH